MLNFEYKGSLIQKSVKYYNMLASLKSQNSVEVNKNIKAKR